MKTNVCYQGDCLDVLKTLPENSVDSIVTDPPYELGFMGKSWDNSGIAYSVPMWKECLRVLKPGGHLLSFSGTRTYHRMAVAIEDAGFEVRDMIEWCYGSGFPKSMNISLAIDKQKGLQGQRGVGGFNVGGKGEQNNRSAKLHIGSTTDGSKQPAYNDAKSEESKQWKGWGTALKPAHEPICLARKPLSEKTVAENVLKYGTGGINIDESRVESELSENRERHGGGSSDIFPEQGNKPNYPSGRFPANLIHDNSEEVRECFPESSVTGKRSQKSIDNCIKSRKEKVGNSQCDVGGNIDKITEYTDSGSSARFFKSILYYPKASKSERNKNTNNYLIIEICVDNTEVAQLQPRVILEKTELWFTELFGKEKMEEYQMDFKSTIKTETKKTTILATLNYSQHLNIKEYIVGAIKTKMESGGNPVVSVENTNEWKQIIIKELTEYLLGVNPVVSPTQLRISVNANNFHSTVKPIALCEYLIKMITPKGGIVLDPFAGSGSTLVAAKENGFQYVGIELTEEYLPIIQARTGCEIIKPSFYSTTRIDQAIKEQEEDNVKLNKELEDMCLTVKTPKNICPNCGGKLVKTKYGKTCEDCLNDY